MDDSAKRRKAAFDVNAPEAEAARKTGKYKNISEYMSKGVDARRKLAGSDSPFKMRPESRYKRKLGEPLD